MVQDLRKILVRSGLIAALVLLFAAPPAAAQDKDEESAGDAAAAKKRFVFGEEDIEGEIPRPDVEYIIARQDTTEADEQDLKKSFVPKLLSTVKKKPF